MIVYPDIDVKAPAVTDPSGLTVFVSLSGFAGLMAESPSENSHFLYFEKCRWLTRDRTCCLSVRNQ